MKMYHVDAFTDTLFRGNPAAVVPLDAWPPDGVMQNIAAENNLAETAFVVPEGDEYWIRWFTPSVEVDLCGHATLASAFVLFNELGHPGHEIRFHSRSGMLTVTREGETIILNFPADPPASVQITDAMRSCVSGEIVEAWRGKRDYMLVMQEADEVGQSTYDAHAILQLGHAGLIITAPGGDVDFVSRFFAPAYGIPEDPVTGSAHTTLTPYWANRFGKTIMTARQLSSRGGFLRCRLDEHRVQISGQGVLYMKGDIFIKG